jgi:aminoglycoside phosphotransferase (APT) family kinase protein
LAEQFSGWRTLLAAPVARLDRWSSTRLPELAELEARWPAAGEGDRLVHGDLRADNVLLTPSGAVIVDWPAACRGSPLLGLALLAPSVAMQGGPAPRELLARTTAGRGAEIEVLTPLVCAFAGYLTERSLQPPPPGLPTLRAFQAAQAVEAVRWLAELLST